MKYRLLITAAAALLAAPLAANAFTSLESSPPAQGAQTQGPMQGSSGSSANFTGSADTQTAPASGAPDASSATSATSASGDAAARTDAAAPAMTDTLNPEVVSNKPVPDTTANRAKYPPLSRTGLHTKPTGD